MSTQNHLTPDDLKKFKGLENLTDEQAIYFAEQVNNYAAILLMAFPLDETMKNSTDLKTKK